MGSGVRINSATRRAGAIRTYLGLTAALRSITTNQGRACPRGKLRTSLHFRRIRGTATVHVAMLALGKWITAKWKSGLDGPRTTSGLLLLVEFGTARPGAASALKVNGLVPARKVNAHGGPFPNPIKIRLALMPNWTVRLKPTARHASTLARRKPTRQHIMHATFRAISIRSAATQLHLAARLLL